MVGKLIWILLEIYRCLQQRKKLQIDQELTVIAMVRAAQFFFDSQCINRNYKGTFRIASEFVKVPLLSVCEPAFVSSQCIRYISNCMCVCCFQRTCFARVHNGAVRKAKVVRLKVSNRV